MSKGMHWVYLIIISILLILVWQERDLPTPADAMRSAEVENQADIVAQERDRNMDALLGLIDSLQEENRELLEEIEALQQEKDALVEKDIEIATARSRESTAQPDEERNAGHEDNSARAQQAVMDGEDLRERLATEDVDPSWAYQLEIDLEDIFMNHESLRDLDVHNIECRTTVCAIDIAHDGTVTGLNIPVLFKALISEPWFAEGNYALVSFSETETDTTQVIIRRTDR